MKNRRKMPWYRLGMLVLFLSLFCYAGYQFLSDFRENQRSSQMPEELMEQGVVVFATVPPTTAQGAEVTVPQEAAPCSTDSTEAPTDPSAAATEPLPPISCDIPLQVDFEALDELYPDVVGWLYCAGTPLNYPVVQSDDNSYYLHRLPDGSENVNGSLFMDCRALSDMSDRNTVVYGHNMSNGTMFGFLGKYRGQVYYDAHPVMWYLTPERAYKLEPVAGMVTASDSEAYDIFGTDDALQEYLTTATAKSDFQSNAAAEGIKQIVTLSTCSYEFPTARYVVISGVTPVEYPEAMGQ